MLHLIASVPLASAICPAPAASLPLAPDGYLSLLEIMGGIEVRAYSKHESFRTIFIVSAFGPRSIADIRFYDSHVCEYTSAIAHVMLPNERIVAIATTSSWQTYTASLSRTVAGCNEMFT